MNYCIATFHSVHEALRFEQVIKEMGLNLQLVPVPREISSSCGIAARFSYEELPQFKEAITQHQLDVDQIHVLSKKPQKKKNLLSFLD